MTERAVMTTEEAAELLRLPSKEFLAKWRGGVFPFKPLPYSKRKKFWNYSEVKRYIDNNGAPEKIASGWNDKILKALTHGNDQSAVSC